MIFHKRSTLASQVLKGQIAPSSLHFGSKWSLGWHVAPRELAYSATSLLTILFAYSTLEKCPFSLDLAGALSPHCLWLCLASAPKAAAATTRPLTFLFPWRKKKAKGFFPNCVRLLRAWPVYTDFVMLLGIQEVVCYWVRLSIFFYFRGICSSIKPS